MYVTPMAQKPHYDYYLARVAMTRISHEARNDYWMACLQNVRS